MRKILLFIICLCQLNSIDAQTSVYHPFPSDSAVWFNKSWTTWVGPFYYKMEMIGDTVIGGFSYKKIYCFSSPNYYKGAIRQNIPAKKVYFMDTTGVEKILHDFNLAVGDTVDVTNSIVYVSAIDSTLVGNKYHKSFILASDNPQCSPSTLIEGIGYNGGFDCLYNGFFESFHQLTCFSVKNSTSLFPNDPNYPTCSLSINIGVDNFSKNEIKISVMPNPTKDEISLSIGYKDSYTIEIKNNVGQSVYYEENVMPSGLKIDLSAYKSGIYFVRVNDTKGNYTVKKIVKE